MVCDGKQGEALYCLGRVVKLLLEWQQPFLTSFGRQNQTKLMSITWLFSDTLTPATTKTLVSRSTGLVLNSATAELEDFEDVVQLAIDGYTTLDAEIHRALYSQLTSVLLPILPNQVKTVFLAILKVKSAFLRVLTHLGINNTQNLIR